MANKHNDYDTVTLIDHMPCKFMNVVGYCHNISHKGYLNKRLLSKHQCIDKQCWLLEKYNLNYWNALAKTQYDKQKRREVFRQKKLQLEERNKFIRLVFEPYSCIFITSIHEKNYGLMITYIYTERVDLSEAINVLRQEYKCAIHLKATRSTREIQRRLIHKKQYGIERD